MPGAYAFTAIAPGRSSVLKSPCDIEPASGTSGAFCSFNAIWDTGATHSVILQEVVGRCGLKANRQDLHSPRGNQRRA